LFRRREQLANRKTLIQLVVLGLSVIAVGILWFFWHTPALDRPDSEFAGGIRVGIGKAPPDTRVFFNFDPWNDTGNPSLGIVLGQSNIGPRRQVTFRIEFDGFLSSPDRDLCPDARTPNTCWTGDGTVQERKQPRNPTTVLRGTFLATGFTRIDTAPQLGATRNGPYRSIYQEFGLLETNTKLRYPARGIEAEITTGVGSTGARYEGFFPAQPYGLYADGWAWLLREPGGPIGMQITDNELEQRLRQRSEIAGLFIGVFIALFVQVGYELARSLIARSD
jgi:hypothetical protein